MSTTPQQQYILGTHDDEIDRLGFQHRIWRPKVLECWQRSGITTGSRVIDLGAGPGFATVDLAELVGETGKVLALERSEKFVAYGSNQCSLRGLPQVQYRQFDLMTDAINEENFDATWCRWVAAFVSSPAQLVTKISNALKPGGLAIFHEYIDYRTYRVAPRKLAIEEFVAKVTTNWRASGGEPEIGLELPHLLHKAGFQIRSTIPMLFVAPPGTMIWNWPASFIRTHLDHLLQHNQADLEWVTKVRTELEEAEADPASLFITPTVLEIVAERLP